MNKKNILSQASDFAKQQLGKDKTGHDWWHTERVARIARTIAADENADAFIVELAALLHDVGDPKFHSGDESVAKDLISSFLQSFGVRPKLVETITSIVSTVSYSKTLRETPNQDTFFPTILPIEARVVCDADRLDAMGAIGIARTFAFGGHFGRPIYTPEISYRKDLTREQYLAGGDSTSINHFYEKLLLLKDGMFTKTGRDLAKARHEFMLLYLHNFFAEWKGDI